MGEAETQWWSARGRDEFCAGTRIVREGGEGGVVASRYPQENKEGSIKMHIKKKKKKKTLFSFGRGRVLRRGSHFFGSELRAGSRKRRRRRHKMKGWPRSVELSLLSRGASLLEGFVCRWAFVLRVPCAFTG